MSLKIALMFGTGAGLAVGLIEVAAGIGLTGNPLFDGLAGGASITLTAVVVYKYKVDRLEKDVEKKADLAHVNQRFDAVEKALGRIEAHMLGMGRSG